MNHDWVSLENVIYPLPRDIKKIVKNFIKNEKESMTFSDTLDLYQNRKSDLNIIFNENIFMSANVSANKFSKNFKINGLQAKLYSYQSKGVQFMNSVTSYLGGVILADEMGLGKTMQIISLLLLKRHINTSPALIICPTSLIANWAREIDKFAPTLDYIIHRGSLRTGISSGLQKAPIVISTYETVVNDISIFNSIKWSFLICDVAQALKNPKAERRIALNSLERSITIPVTGTPMENKLLDLWSIVDFTIPNLLGKQSTFEKNFIDSEDNATIINKIINPVILKRMVSDVADDLPERMDINIPITLTTDLKKKYLEILQETISMYPKNGAMVATTRLQIFCAHPSLQNVLSKKNHKEVDDENFLETSFEDIPLISSYDKNLYNPKIEITKQIIQEAVLNNDKILIFALFNKCGPIIKNECKDIKKVLGLY